MCVECYGQPDQSHDKSISGTMMREKTLLLVIKNNIMPPPHSQDYEGEDWDAR